MALPVSMVIPAHNRQQVVRHMIPAYLRQGCAELVIVDDASDPPIEKYESTAETRITMVRTEKQVNHPASRMIAARAASQPYIFYGEDDAFPSDGCVASLYDYVSSGGGKYDIVAPVWITVKTLPADTPVKPPAKTVTLAEEIVDRVNLHFDGSNPPQYPIEVPWLHTPALMRRQDILDVQFDPTFQGYPYREETDFYIRAGAAGLKMHFVPGPPVFHYKGPLNPTTGLYELTNLARCEYWVFKNNTYFLRKNAAILKALGIEARPLADSTAFLMRRLKWYWRRLWLKLFGPPEAGMGVKV